MIEESMFTLSSLCLAAIYRERIEPAAISQKGRTGIGTIVSRRGDWEWTKRKENRENITGNHRLIRGTAGTSAVGGGGEHFSSGGVGVGEVG